MDQPVPKPWEVPQTPQAAPMPAADPSMDPGLLDAIKRLFMGNQQPAPLQGVMGGGQGGVLDPLQQAAQLQQRNRTIAKGTPR